MMGSKDSKEHQEDDDGVDQELTQEDASQINYTDAVKLMSNYLKKLNNNANDGKSNAVNQVENIVTKVLSEAISFPAFVDYNEEDKKLSDKILSLYWVMPKHLEVAIDTTNDSTLKSFADAIHLLAIMTTRENAFQRMSCIVDCTKHVMAGMKEHGGADELLPGTIFVILKSNPPRLYSHLKFLSNFVHLNEQTMNYHLPIHDAVPRVFGTMMDYCITNLLLAVTMIRNIEADHENNIITFGNADPDYMCGEEVNDRFEDDLQERFDELKVCLCRLIYVRIEIRDKHREDMLAIADKLDTHKRNVHISKAIGCSAAIGGSIVSIIGFGLMFTTFGVSGLLIPIGAAIGGAGGLTASISGFVEYGIQKSNANSITELREEYETAINEVFASLKKIEDTVNNMQNYFKLTGKVGKSVLILVDVVMKLTRLAVAVDNVVDVGVAAFRAATTAGRGIAIAGVVFSAVMLPIDILFLGISIKKLKDNEKASQAQAIREWLEQDLPNEGEINEIVSKLRLPLFNFISKVKSYRGEKDDALIAEFENELKIAMEKVREVMTTEFL